MLLLRFISAARLWLCFYVLLRSLHCCLSVAIILPFAPFCGPCPLSFIYSTPSQKNKNRGVRHHSLPSSCNFPATPPKLSPVLMPPFPCSTAPPCASGAALRLGRLLGGGRSFLLAKRCRGAWGIKMAAVLKTQQRREGHNRAARPFWCFRHSHFWLSDVTSQLEGLRRELRGRNAGAGFMWLCVAVGRWAWGLDFVRN